MAKELTELEKHYNKFNEEKRLGRRHGQLNFENGFMIIILKLVIRMTQYRSIDASLRKYLPKG